MLGKFEEKIFKQIKQYNMEYKKAIKKLLNTENVNDILAPLTALIVQYIENCFKSFLQDYFEVLYSAKKLNINTHDCRKLIEMYKEKYSIYMDMTNIKNPLERIEKYLDYLEKIYGKEILINSRYALDSGTLRINQKEIKVKDEEFKFNTQMMIWSFKSLFTFYQCEKLYTLTLRSELPAKKLKDLLNEMSKDEDFTISKINVSLIKLIDEKNKKLL